MTSRDFCFWLQGHFELAALDDKPASAELQAARMSLIEKHLHLAFVHDIDPSMGDADHQAKLNEAHSGLKELLEKASSGKNPGLLAPHKSTVMRC